MRKFIFFLLLIPIFASLGHDIYIFKQSPDKGFHLSALGALWDKYHKESHDQWKTKIREIGETVGKTVDELTNNELINIQNPGKIKETEGTTDEDNPKFTEEFTQIDSIDNKTEIRPLQVEDTVETNTNSFMEHIGFILEQKAIFVFSALAALVYFLNAILSRLFRQKESTDEIKSIKKKKRKGGGYAYGRK